MDDLVSALRRAAVKSEKNAVAADKIDEDNEIERLYLLAKQETTAGADVSASAEKSAKAHVIPPFYRKLPSKNSVIQLKLREDARASMLQRRNEQLLVKEELKELYMILARHRTEPFDSDDDVMIGWADFCAVAAEAGAKARPYFRASVFAKLQQGDVFGRISVLTLFNYIMRRVWLHQTRISLSMYDTTGDGYLCEPDLEDYVHEMIRTLPLLNSLEKSFHSFYQCTAVRKFFFFLDPMRTGRIRIRDILCSGFLDELLELRGDDVSKESLESNWFSATSALRVYGQYLNMDLDNNGMLSKQELARYDTGTLTTAFIDQLFDTCLTYGGEMDYRAYLDVVLALENRRQPQALQFLFRVLDIRRLGYLDGFVLNYFFRAIQQQLVIHNQTPVSFNDIKDELFDMVKPKLPDRITLQDLINCGQGHTVVSILIDLNGFWTYDSRETISADPTDNADSQ